MKRLSFILALILLFLPIVSCSSNRSERFQIMYTDVFDTVTEFTVYCDSKKTFNDISAVVHDELLRLHRLFDIYTEYYGVYNLYTVNNADKSSPIEVPEEIAELVSLGKEMYSLTDGALNIGMGAVLSVWHRSRTEGKALPVYSVLNEAYKSCDLDTLVVSGCTLDFADKDLKLDFGALAKGYAADKAAALLKENGINDFALNLGGNVITSGTKNGNLWKIGVEDPAGGVLETLSVTDISVVTSGDYQRYYTVDGVNYHHIIDSETLFPASRYHSVTVICESSEYADALSTALFCLDIGRGRALAQKYGAEVMWITTDDKIIRSDGFEKFERIEK